MVKKTSKSTENKCSHCALQLILIGKDAHRKGNIRHVIDWSQAISGHFSCLFRSKIAKITKDKCSHCAMGLDYCFRWLSTVPSQRNIALWVHPLTTATQVPADRQPPQPAHTRFKQKRQYTCRALKIINLMNIPLQELDIDAFI